MLWITGAQVTNTTQMSTFEQQSTASTIIINVNDVGVLTRSSSTLHSCCLSIEQLWQAHALRLINDSQLDVLKQLFTSLLTYTADLRCVYSKKTTNGEFASLHDLHSRQNKTKTMKHSIFDLLHFALYSVCISNRN